MTNTAWVTLATNDSYAVGALVVAHSLRRVATQHPAVVMVTPAVTDVMRECLQQVFAEVVLVDVLSSGDAAHLALLQRPELGITFTKLHCWNLTQYDKCVFLDADTLVLQNCDDLFEREELSASPDVGWPDCFNSGVFVFAPSKDTFASIIKMAEERGSFDGGDQGILNTYFSGWAQGDSKKRLPFLYNVTSAAFYSYLPALKQYGQDIKIIHYIGVGKPWLHSFNWETGRVNCSDHLQPTLQLWWDIFRSCVHPMLHQNMSGVAGNLARVPCGDGSAQSEAVSELSRRQGWETGNIDYMGADSFDNIWAKISQTLNEDPKRSQGAEATADENATTPSAAPEPIATEVAAEPTKVESQDILDSEPKTESQEKPVEVETPVPAQQNISPAVEEKVAPEETTELVKETPQSTEDIQKTDDAKTETAADSEQTVPSPVSTESQQTSLQIEEKEVTEEKEASTSEPQGKAAGEEKEIEKSTTQEQEATPDNTLELSAASAESPPLANTPAKEQAPLLGSNSSEEAAQETGL